MEPSFLRIQFMTRRGMTLPLKFPCTKHQRMITLQLTILRHMKDPRMTH